MSVNVIHGDMRDVLGKMIAEGKLVQSIVTDPPYHLTNQRSAGGRGFMGKQWDGGDIAFQPGTWRLCFELLPPGGYLLAFAGTRTYHRMAVAIEEAGFEIRDTIAWHYGSGFPKSSDYGAIFDKALLGIDRNEDPKDWEASRSHFATWWKGWGTALKPAMELICVARKPLDGTVAANVLKHGAGALNIDATRVAAEAGFEEYVAKTARPNSAGQEHLGSVMNGPSVRTVNTSPLGRWPANVCHDGSAEVVRAFPAEAGSNSTDRGRGKNGGIFGNLPTGSSHDTRADGGAARFFYSAKADADDRLGSKHPTIKPVDLMRWLVRLITPPGGTVLDPFAGSGATGMACMAEGIDCILVEREAEYVADIKARIAHVHGEDTPLFSGVMP